MEASADRDPGLPPSHPQELTSRAALQTAGIILPKVTESLKRKGITRKGFSVVSTEGKLRSHKRLKQDLQQEYSDKLQSLFLEVSVGWTKNEGFVPGYRDDDILRYLKLNNELNRYGLGSKWCVRCGRKKEKKCDRPESHIWASGLLEIARDVHCDEECTKFIFNTTTRRPMGSYGLTVQLLCNDCEGIDCEEERRLCKLYRRLVGNEKLEEIKEWLPSLQKMLVKVLFLGIMINCDVEKELLKDKQFQNVFMDLWKYYMHFAKNKTARNKLEDPSMPDLRLFLLSRDSPPKDLEENYRAFRNLSFTSLVQSNGAVFLYTQFDIFHVVVPVNDKSRQDFDLHTNFLHSHRLLKCVCTDNGQDTLFPPVLLKENEDRIRELEEKCDSMSGKDDVLFLVEFLKLMPTEEPPADTRASNTEDWGLEDAKKNSPFRRLSRGKIAGLERQVARLEDKLHAEKRKTRAATMEVKNWKERYDNLAELYNIYAVKELINLHVRT